MDNGADVSRKTGESLPGPKSNGGVDVADGDGAIWREDVS